MIKSLHIQNFKSIKDIKIDCSRVNIFIGEPNTGKSNILETVGILSFGYTRRIENIVRFEETSNLFWNEDISQVINIFYKITQESAQFPKMAKNHLEHELIISYVDNRFLFISTGELLNCKFEAKYTQTFYENYIYDPDPIVKLYEFKQYKTFPDKKLEFLMPINGRNLLSIILTNPDVKSYTSDLLAKFGYKILIDNERSKISIAKDIESILIKHPYSNLADTLQRMIFYYACLESNKNSILVFDEPDVYTFPFYSEQLALMIANNTNQFFISTHNPYFLNMLVNKTKEEELRVYKATYKNYQTDVQPIDKDTLQKFIINGNDIIFNIDKLGVDG